MIKKLIYSGLVAAVTCGITLAQTTQQRQMAIVVGFKDGVVVAAQVIGGADNISNCQKGLAQALPEMQAAHPDMVLVPLCTPEPPAPAATITQSPIKTKPVERL